MKASEEVKYVFDLALELLDKKEEVYGDSWKKCGKEVCIPETFRKSNYIRVQYEKGLGSTDKFLEDILDAICWHAFSYHLVNEETKESRK